VSSERQRVVIVFSKGCSFECVRACLDTAREFGIEPIWYHGIPPPIPPMTNSVVLEAVDDVDVATMIVVVGTELPVTPAWLRPRIGRSLERGARFFEYVLSSEQLPIEALDGDEQSPLTATSIEELQNFLKSAFQ
jgi:hypothetical protein